MAISETKIIEILLPFINKIAFRNPEIRDLIKFNKLSEIIHYSEFEEENIEKYLGILQSFLTSDLTPFYIIEQVFQQNSINLEKIEKDFTTAYKSCGHLPSDENPELPHKIFRILVDLAVFSLKGKLTDKQLLSLDASNELRHKQSIQAQKEILKEIKKIDSSKNEDTEPFNRNIDQYLNHLLELPELNECLNFTDLTTYIREILPLSFKIEGKDSKSYEVEISGLVKVEKKIIIIGEAGSGKTTSLKWLTIQLANQFKATRKGKIPVYIALNAYSEGKFSDFVFKQVQFLGMTKNSFEILCRNGNFAFLIDGLDLISDNRSVLHFISVNDGQYILSSRPNNFDAFGKQFKTAFIEPLSFQKIGMYIDNYLEEDKELSSHLTKKIRKSEDLIEICKNPLLLYLMICVAKKRKKRNNQKPLPDSRTALIDEFITDIFTHYKESHPELSISDQELIYDICIKLAFTFQQNGVVAMSFKDTRNYFENYLEKHPKRTYLAADQIFSLIKDVGFITLHRYKVEFNFHQSFQEFFAACFLTDLFNEDYDLSQVFIHPKWENVLILVSEMVENPDNFVNEIISTDNLELAAKCSKKANNDTKTKLCENLYKLIKSIYRIDRLSGIDSLIMMGTYSIPLLCKLTNFEESDIKLRAVMSLGVFKSNVAIEPLFHRFQNDEDLWVRTRAAESLGRIGSEQSLDKLIDVMTGSNEDEWNRGLAAYILGEIKSKEALPRLTQQLKSNADPTIRALIAFVIMVTPSDTVARDLTDHLCQEQDGDVRAVIIYGLGKMRYKQAEKMIINSLISDSDALVRARAADSLGIMKSIIAIKPLMERLFLENEDNMVRSRILLALCKIKETKKPTELIERLHSDDDSWIRDHANEVEYFFQTIPIIEPLIDRLLNDKSGWIRARSAYEIGERQLLQGETALIDRLSKDEYKWTRALSAYSLGELKSEKAIPTLIELLMETQDPTIRNSAAEALGKIKSEKSIEPLIDILVNHETTDEVRRSVAKIFSEIRPINALEPLKEILCNSRIDRLTREYIADTFSIIGSQSDTKTILPLLNNPDPLISNTASLIIERISKKKKLDKKVFLLNAFS